MNGFTLFIVTRAEIWLCITTLFYFLMNGAQVFETFVLIPKWTSDPPGSLHYFKGKYALDLKTFWVVLHSLHEVTFILAIVFCWKLVIGKTLLVLFLVHLAARIWTILYFAPNIIQFQRMANQDSAGSELARKINVWRRLNYIRVSIFLGVSIELIPLCMKALNLTLN